MKNDVRARISRLAAQRVIEFLSRDDHPIGWRGETAVWKFWRSLNQELSQLASKGGASYEDITFAQAIAADAQDQAKRALADRRLPPPEQLTPSAKDDPQWLRASEAAHVVDLLAPAISKLVKNKKVRSKREMVNGHPAVFVSLKDLREAKRHIQPREGRRRKPVVPEPPVRNPFKR